MKPGMDSRPQAACHAGWGWLLLAVANLGAALFIGLTAWSLGQAAAPMEAVPARPHGAAPSARPAQTDPASTQAPAAVPRAPATGEASPGWAQPAELSPHPSDVPGR